MHDVRARRETVAPPENRSSAVVAVWIAAAAACALTLLAMLALGPPLGRLLAPGGGARFWPEIAWMVRPEPTEHARYLIALLGPAVLVALTVALARRPLPLAPAASTRLVAGLEALAVAALAACLALQRAALFHRPYGRTPHIVYFTVPTLIAAAALAVAIVAVCRRNDLLERVRAWTAESPARAAVAAAVAVAAVAITVLPAIVTETSVLHASDEFVYHVRFVYDETAAVLDGRSPLGDFAAQYGSLWPYLLALPLAPFDASLGLFTVELALLSCLALLALYALLRRVTRSSLLALALFLPLLATSAFRLHDPSTARFSLINYFGTMPLRYAGPFLLAWLLARHLDGARPRRAAPLLAVAGLVAINNTDFGIPALGATVVALAVVQPPTAVRLRALARDLLLGLAAAATLVTLLVLARTGEPPHLSWATRYARLFAVDGFGMSPLHPLLGMSTVVFLTYVTAIGVAIVLVLRRAGDAPLAGLLMWSGVFGLGAGGYYVGRSIPEVLTNMFPAWALAVALLTVVAVRALASRRGRRPLAIELACLFAFGLLVCSLAQTPSLIAQARRIAADGPRYLRQQPTQAFLAAHARHGEPVVMLTELGHLIAYRAGVEDVTPYTGNESIQAQEQLDDALAALRAAGGRDVFLATTALTPPSMRAALAARGLQLAATAPDAPLELWVMTRS
ncbi:MAG: hypothetical protein ACTHOE_03470 [Conexibacter sp.]